MNNVTVAQEDRDAYNCLMQDEGYDHEPAGAWHFASHREQTEAAFKAREAALVEALEAIAALRPWGDVKTARNTRALVEQMEVIAMRALTAARALLASEPGK